jgi:hypothetical protein
MELDRGLREAIERVPWGALEHAYGSARDTPGALRALAADERGQREVGYDHLFYSVHHQGTVYSATVEVVPILVQMLAVEGLPDKHMLLEALTRMYHGTSYHDVHRGMMLMGNTDTPEYQAKVDRELGRVAEVKRRVRAGLPVYLPLLTANAWETRLYAPLLLLSLSEDYPAIRPVAVAAFEREAHPLCRAAALLLAGETGEPMRPRWDGGLRHDPSLLIRVLAAMSVVRQERENTPPEVTDTLLRAMTAPEPQLQEQYAQLPTQSNLVADAGAALSWAGPTGVERVIDNLVADLQKGPDVGVHRTQLMLQLTCVLAKEVPFAKPESLNPLQARVARECRRQLGLELSGGFRMSGFLNYTEVLRAFSLPDREDKFDEYLAKVPTAR